MSGGHWVDNQWAANHWLDGYWFEFTGDPPSGRPVATTRYEQIHNLLVDAALDYTFPVVKFDKTSHRANPYDGETQDPGSIQANQTGSSFESAERYGLGLRQSRAGWQWQMTLVFQSRIRLDGFERSLMENPPRLDSDEFGPTVIMRLTDSDVDDAGHHSSRGTKVTYSFDADELSV